MEWTGEFVRWIDEPGPELPSATTGSPEAAFTATWQATAERKVVKLAKFLPTIALISALTALVLSLAGLMYRPSRYVELREAAHTRRHQLEQQLNSFKPKDTTSITWLVFDIKMFDEWKDAWRKFLQAYRAYGALTDETTRYDADMYDRLLTPRVRKTELELKTVAVEAFKPPTLNSQIITSVDEVIQLAHTLIEVGWDKDVKLSELLEERANWEQPRDPENAKQLRKVVENLK